MKKSLHKFSKSYLNIEGCFANFVALLQCSRSGLIYASVLNPYIVSTILEKSHKKRTIQPILGQIVLEFLFFFCT